MSARLAIALVLSMIVAPPRASAQTTSRASARAAQLFEDGERAFARHDYVEALAAFRGALEADPHDVVRLNVAVCLERLARPREAIDEYTLAARSELLDPAARRHALEQAERLRPALATLVVDLPAGASVLVDGAERCRAPCRERVDPRPQTVTVRAGAAEHVERIEPGRGAEVVVVATGLSADRPASALATPPAAPSAAPSTQSSSPHVLLGIGATIAAIGAGGAIGFGVHAGALHDRYLAMPTADLRSEGLAIQTAANASYVILGIGAILVLVDLLLPTGETAPPVARLARGIAF